MIGVAALSVAGFAQSGLGGVRWELTELNGRQVPGSRVLIEFDDAARRFSGNAGCNRIFGNYDLTRQRFKAKEIGSTKMACADAGTMRREARFLEALRTADRLRRNGATLSLIAGGKRVAKFRQAKRFEREPVTMDLTAKRWMLRSLNGETIELTKNAPFLNFDGNKGSAGGNSGCNVFGGSYEALGSSIKFGDMMQTMMACEFERRMEVERRFLNGLRNADRFGITGNRLTLFRGSRELMVFHGISK